MLVVLDRGGEFISVLFSPILQSSKQSANLPNNTKIDFSRTIKFIIKESTMRTICHCTNTMCGTEIANVFIGLCSTHSTFSNLYRCCCCIIDFLYQHLLFVCLCTSAAFSTMWLIVRAKWNSSTEINDMYSTVWGLYGC